jgi:hypothetical protein
VFNPVQSSLVQSSLVQISLVQISLVQISLAPVEPADCNLPAHPFPIPPSKAEEQ